MWFKNLQIYRLPAPWDMPADQLADGLAAQAFAPCTSLDLQSQGWVAPRADGRLVHVVEQQILLTLLTEKKLLPATVINQVAKARAADIEERQGFKPGRKQMKELKEQVTDELLPRAFSIQRETRVWIDPKRGWLVVDSGSAARADEVLKLLLKAVERLPLANLHVAQSPRAAMTGWLAADQAPSGFTLDADIELRAGGDGGATVRYAREAPDVADLQRHIASGKQCTRLALTWNDRVSLLLTESLAIKRVAALDVITENAATGGGDEDERFDADFALMAGELSQMLAALVQALGGEKAQQAAA
jgi:recombination associated protein RdgC